MTVSGKSKFETFTAFCRLAVARGSTLPVDLARLAERSEREILAAVAANPATPAEMPGRLIEEVDWITTELILSEKRLPLQIALKFAKHTSVAVRETAVGFPGAPPELLTSLARDSDVDVRLAVAGSPSAPDAALIELAQAADDDVREAVAYNPSAPVNALRYLIHDPLLSIRYFIALRSQLVSDLFEVLSRDEHERVRCALANNEYLGELELDCLWLDSSDQVRCIIASRRLSKTEWVAKMSQEAVEEARRAAAYRPKTLAEILKDLKLEILDGDLEVPRVLEENSDENVRSRKKCQ